MVDPQQARSIFLEAVERHAPNQWSSFLDEACGADQELRKRVEVLLRAHDQANSMLDVAAIPQSATLDQPVAERPGTVVGLYKLIEPIGEGGMGTVWMAQQTEPVKRLVALKLIKAGMDSKQVLARFEAERQALALMDHPNIAKVHDGGATADGRPYFVMELVKGQSITKYCDEHHLTPRQRLELFIPVCQAVQHAHQKGIIHRDLKPSNVLVAQYDGRPVPKVIDFGVAKAAGQPLTDKTLVTGFGAIVGTLEYMSPEQAEINQFDIDTRSDIYSLGVLLYELLTGSTPFSKKDLEKAGMLEMLRVIREDEPSKPSTKLSSSDALPTLSANRGTEPTKLTRLVRGELDWIVMKALEKDRARRYETANGFAADVQRYLADEAVHACPPSAGYRLRKFTRRNKGGLAAAAVVLFCIVLLGSGAGWMMRDRAARHVKVAGQVELILVEVDRLEAVQKWPEALASLRRAEAAVAGGEADAETAERVRGRLKDLEFIDRLEQIRMQRAMAVDGKFDDPDRADQEFARAFREYGADLESLPIEHSIDRLKPRPALSMALTAVLQNWANDRARITNEKHSNDFSKRLIAIARGIDPEPLRDWLRSNFGKGVSADELRRVVKALVLHDHHPSTINTFASRLLAMDWDAAIKLMRDAQRVHPGDFWLAFNLAHRLYVQKDFEGAARFYTAAISIRPQAIAAINNLGIVLREQKKLDEAVATYHRALEIDPKDAIIYSNLGIVLREQNKLDEAIVAFRKAIELDPKYAGAYSNLGLALVDQQKLDEAVACYRKAIELDSKDAIFHFNIGVTLTKQKKLVEAIASYRKAIELNPKYVAAYSNLGLALVEQKKLDDAVATFRKSIEIDPKLTIAYFNLGLTLARQNKLAEAVACYRKAIEIDPKYADVHLGLGVALAYQKKLDEAVSAFRRVIEIDPKNAMAHHNLGIALVDQKKLDEAVACYRKVIELDSKDAETHNALAWLLATGPDGVRDGKDAVEHATEACKQTGWKELRYLDTLAAAYAEAGDFDKAVEFQNKTLANMLFLERLLGGKEFRERLKLYEQKKPYRDPTLAARDVTPPREGNR